MGAFLLHDGSSRPRPAHDALSGIYGSRDASLAGVVRGSTIGAPDRSVLGNRGSIAKASMYPETTECAKYIWSIREDLARSECETSCRILSPSVLDWMG